MIEGAEQSYRLLPSCVHLRCKVTNKKPKHQIYIPLFTLFGQKHSKM